MNKIKLPEPPPSQVYALMQKIKSFGSLTEISKSIRTIGKKKSLSPKINTSQTNSPIYEKEVISSPNKGSEYSDKYSLGRKSKRKSSKHLLISNTKSSDNYENLEFHSPTYEKQISTSSQFSPIQNNSNNSIYKSNDEQNIDEPSQLSRKKSKGNKSFKSKWKGGLGGVDNDLLNVPTPMGGTRSTFYVTDTVDIDSGIFSGSNDKIQTNDESNPLNETEITPDIINSEPPPLTSRTKNRNKTPDTQRRQSAPTSRPNNPPPPPPSSNKRQGYSSWYAECGVFTSVTGMDLNNATHKMDRRDRSSTTSWYTDVGLYQTSAESIASSSTSSGISAGGDGSPSNDESKYSMFSNEPLYQIYNAAKIEVIITLR